MRKGYKIGKFNDPIVFKANIGTPGIVNTKVFQFFGDRQSKLLTESNVDSGNIQETSLGKGSDLINSYLKIRSIIDFGTIDSSQWEQLYDNIVGKYGISGGFAGNQSYSYDEEDKTKSSNGRFVVIDMEIDLKK